MTHICCPSSFAMGLSLFELATCTSARAPGFHVRMKRELTHAGMYVHAYTCNTRRECMALGFAEIQQRICGISDYNQQRDSHTSVTHSAISCYVRRRLYKAFVSMRLCDVLSLLGINAVFYVDTSQLEQPFVIFSSSFDSSSETEAIFEAAK